MMSTIKIRTQSGKQFEIFDVLGAGTRRMDSISFCESPISLSKALPESSTIDAENFGDDKSSSDVLLDEC